MERGGMAFSPRRRRRRFSRAARRHRSVLNLNGRKEGGENGGALGKRRLRKPLFPPSLSFLRGKTLLPWRSTYMMGGSARFPHFSEKKREEKLHTHAFQEDRKDAEDYLSSQRWRRCKKAPTFPVLEKRNFCVLFSFLFPVGDRKQTKTLI